MTYLVKVASSDSDPILISGSLSRCSDIPVLGHLKLKSSESSRIKLLFFWKTIYSRVDYVNTATYPENKYRVALPARS
jgi:hypothetical protein